ncbi:uncharacterized protein STEHIDRAFT_135215 [Stereum hirsutum FP-91666 SS1]|uniref:Cupin 2 conserved barrel domain-containing protein n=1 Tax=Stereum hirsutum (strain FP-91666) TaxID=721885 RepID=R7RXY6_STEHR|nr:uncharacterized protein STEHIDRAFT_135215 [Stereum hirsutum FP-91666 SS1]EIM80271.1 hypothetical protein STEHIDRAFT_135215 [Stereum hirsutum FP-91666 SS1]
MAPAKPTVFTVLEDDTVMEDGKGNTFLFTKLPTSQYRPEEPRDPLDQTRYIVRGISPLGATFLVPPHWHPHTTEYFRVFVGSVTATVSGKTRTITPADGEFEVPKGEVHSLLVPDDVYAEYGERAEGEETEKKKSRMLMTLLGKGGQIGELSPVQALRLFFADGDSYPSTGLKPMDIGITYLFGGFFGRTLGFGKLKGAPEELK